MKFINNFTIIVYSLLIFSCRNEEKKKEFEVNLITNNFEQLAAENKGKEEGKSRFGYRFIINGDFDGNGKEENLIEHYFSYSENREANKFISDVDYDSLVVLARKKKPFSYVVSDDTSIDTLKISKNDQLFGLAFLKNEGDLNGDGGDEVSYVVNWADWSNCNTWHIMTYKNRRWIEIYSFPIWDFQLPNLPETFNQYGLFGLEDKVVNIVNDTINQRIEKQMKEFKGLVKKLATNKIQVIYRNDEAEEDTMEIDLRKIK